MLSTDRQEVLKKISEYEKAGTFNLDVEIDPPVVSLKPEDVDYTNKKLSSKIATKIANRLAISYYEKQIKAGDFTIKEVIGLENLSTLSGGAILTCNHFNRADNYVMYKAIKPKLKRGQYLYKVIKEGNYNAYKGLLGYFFKHCNTLPLSSNLRVMKKFMSGVKELLSKGEKILVYPEQSMWWNYTKPRPLMIGAFNIASQNNAPVLPCFITMEDGKKVLSDGSLSKIYTVHIMPAIYPEKNLSNKENAVMMQQKNAEYWAKCYKDFYGEK